jgi:SET domain-containing protein
MLCFIKDDGKYMNHSTEPNCGTDMSTGDTYAIRDIEPGEQLFEDYAKFEHPPFLFPLLEKYKCAPNYYDIPDDERKVAQQVNSKAMESA